MKRSSIMPYDATSRPDRSRGGSIRVVKAGTGTTRCAERTSPRFHNLKFTGVSAPNKANRRRFSAEIGVLQAKRSRISHFLARRVPYPIPNREYSITEPERLGAVSSCMQSEPNFRGAGRVVSGFLKVVYGNVSGYGRAKRTQFKANSIRRETGGMMTNKANLGVCALRTGDRERQSQSQLWPRKGDRILIGAVWVPAPDRVEGRLSAGMTSGAGMRSGWATF